MREFKFRAWNKADGYMVNTPIGVSTIVRDEINGRNESYEILQFTGLKDKNGHEIYEGDMIPYHFDKNVLGIVSYGRYENIFGEGHKAIHIGFYVDWKNDRYKNLLRRDLEYWIEVSEVVGNIYEDKELLGA